MINKILIAIDHSSSAMNAANYGIQLAQALKAKIGVICVTGYNIGNIDAGITSQEMEKIMRKSSDILMDEINIMHPGVVIEEFDPIGDPNREIENVIDLWNPALLIIGHHEHRFLYKILSNNVEKKLLKKLKIPILIVPEN
jgi:nucleotide-binding universal stress UspA family protein